MAARQWYFGIALLVGLSATSGLSVSTGAQAPRPPSVPGAPQPPAQQRDRQPRVVDGTASLSGRVVLAGTGRELRLVQVRLASPAIGRPLIALTDASGRYEFAGLPPGRYVLAASRDGYLSQEYGQLRDFETGSPIELADGQRIERLDFGLSRGSAISGRVVDEYGDGITRARVEALRLEYGPDGVSTTPAGSSGPTDDLGQFRVYGLRPGDYVLRAYTPGSTPGNAAVGPGGDVVMLRNDIGSSNVNGAPIVNDPAESGGAESFAPTYYPGVISPSDAQSIAVTSGQDAAASFAMPIVRFANLSGIVVDAQGRTFRTGTVLLRSAGPIPSITRTQILGNGAFAFGRLAPGAYALEFRTDFFPERNSLVELASQPVAVDGRDIGGLVLATAPGGVVSGRLIFEGGAPPDPARVDVNAVTPGAQSRPGTGPNLTRSPNGGFQLHGLAGAVLFRPVAPQGWLLKSVTLRGQDITDVPYEFRGGESLSDLEIVLTNRVPTVSGSVRDSRGQPVKEYAVVLLPETLARGAVPNRFVRAIRPDREGRFSARGLPAGSYVAAALPSLSPTREWDPQVQAIVRKLGTHLSLSEGQSATLDLSLSTP